jgi:polysaccharide pyruvyl transferase WcaK-like protein
MPRENQALHELESFMCGIEHSKIIPTYESVLTLSNRIEYKTIQHRDNAIGISIYSTQLHTKKKEEIESYLSTIASFCNQAINDGYSIRFFPMELKGSEPDDRPYIKRIISAITEKSKCFMYDNDMETLQHLQEVSKCKIFLGHKTHSTIFALATGTPLIALAYHPKTIEFLKQFGLSANALDDSKLTSEALISIYRNISSNLELISRSEYSKSLELSDRIDADLEIAFKEII